MENRKEACMEENPAPSTVADVSGGVARRRAPPPML